MLSNFPLNDLHSFNLINTSLDTFSRLVPSFIYVTDSPFENFAFLFKQKIEISSNFVSSSCLMSRSVKI